MITLERKAELLSNHVKALEAMGELTSIGYMESKSVQELVYRCLFETGRLTEEETFWLSEQLNDQGETEESIEVKRIAKLHCEITELLMRIDAVYKPVIEFHFQPTLAGVLYNYDEGEEIFGFDSFEEAVVSMKKFLKEHETPTNTTEKVIQAKEDIEIKRTKDLLYQMFQLLIQINNSSEILVSLQYNPGCSGSLILFENDPKSLLVFSSFEDCVQKMQEYLKH